jgi:hypothetical protein
MSNLFKKWFYCRHPNMHHFSVVMTAPKY